MSQKQARLARYEGRHALRSVTTIMRCMDCGREPNGTAVAMRRTDEAVVGYAGLVSCGRVWLCPVCNAKVMARRAIEIGAMLTWASVEGLQVIWGSLTVRHNAASSLAQLLDLQRQAWRFVVSSREWRDDNATRTVEHKHGAERSGAACAQPCERKRDTVLLNVPGRVGYIRAAEITIGQNGWHPHFHPIILVRGSVEDAELIAASVVKLWVEGVEAAHTVDCENPECDGEEGHKGGEARIDGAQQLKVLDPANVYDALGGYVTKATYEPAKLALEAVWSQGKNGRGRATSTVSHWTLLAEIEAGMADGAQRWWELETATKGHRMITWSRGLRSFAGLGQEQLDEEIAAAEVGTKDDTVCYITSEGWRAIRDSPRVLTNLLDMLEIGWPQLQTALDLHGVEYATEPVGLADRLRAEEYAEWLG